MDQPRRPRRKRLLSRSHAADRPVTQEIFEELLQLRQKVGYQLAFHGHAVVEQAMLIVLPKKRSVLQVNRLRAAEAKYGAAPTPEMLLGPRGGIPKDKASLIILARSLGVSETGTVMELSSRCREALGTRRSQAPPTPDVSKTAPTAGTPPPVAGGGRPSGSSARSSVSRGESDRPEWLQQEITASRSENERLKVEAAERDQKLLESAAALVAASSAKVTPVGSPSRVMPTSVQPAPMAAQSTMMAPREHAAAMGLEHVMDLPVGPDEDDWLMDSADTF